MKYFSYIFFILFLLKVPLKAQQNDFQVWPSVKVNLSVSKNFRIHVEEEIRFHENCSQINRQINDVGASYRLNKYLKAGLFYRIEADWKNADEYIWRNGIFADIALRYPVKRFEAGYRLRVQSAKVEMNDNESGLFNSLKNRHKFSITYNVKGIPINVFSDFELFVKSRKDYAEFSGYRTWLGLDYTVNKIHTFSLKYGIDREINVADPVTAYIISAGYTFEMKFNRQKE